jgi:hypothetical protein
MTVGNELAGKLEDAEKTFCKIKAQYLPVGTGENLVNVSEYYVPCRNSRRMSSI